MKQEFRLTLQSHFSGNTKMPILSNDAFLEALSKMSNTVAATGAVSITFKRCNY